MSNGDVPGSGIPGLGPILELLSSIFSNTAQVQDLARSVSSVEQTAWTNLLSLSSWGYGLLGGVLGSLGRELGKVWDELKHLATDVIWGTLKNLLEAIKKWILNLRNFIKVHVATLQQIQKNLDKARGQQFRRIIDIVSRIRKILVPFRLLHLAFASKLDTYLVGIESDIGRKWANLTRHSNAIAAVLDDLVDPRKLLRPGATLGSLGTMVGAVHGAIGALDVRQLFCMSPITTPAPLVEPWSATVTRVHLEITTTSGTYAVYQAQRDEALRQYARDLGVASAA